MPSPSDDIKRTEETPDAPVIETPPPADTTLEPDDGDANPDPVVAMTTLCSEIEQRFATRYQRESTAPQHVPRASAIDKCARAVYYQITAWEQRPKFEPEKLARFERGTVLEERVVVPLISELGFKWLHGQQAFALRNVEGEVICTGHIDGKIRWRGQDVVVDVKTMHPNLWGKDLTVPALLADPYCYRYVNQLLLYMDAHRAEAGLLVIDDCLGHWKLVPIFAADHRDLTAQLKARCELVMTQVRLGVAPAHHDDADHCRRCDWFAAKVCDAALDFSAGGIRIINSDELENALAIREITQGEKREFDAADRVIKKALSDLEDGQYLCGSFAIELSSKPRKGYTVQDGVTQKRSVRRIAEDSSGERLATRLRDSVEGGAA